jgi:hypothetical protein
VFSNYGDDLDPLDVNNNASDVYLRDLQTATTHLISVTPTGQAGDMDSYAMWVSDDGRYVAFSSNADDLVPGDTNGVNDFFLRDRQTATTSLIVLSNSGAQLDDWVGGRFSPDGRYVAFETRATNAVAGDTNQAGDVFVRDLLLSTTQRVTLTPTGGQVTQGSPTTGGFAVIMGFSPDGRFVAVYSDYSDLIEGDSNAAIDGFVIDSRSPLAPVTTYCTAKTTSTGCAPVITCAGEPRASGFDSFFVSASQVRTNTRGGFIWSLAANAAPFGGGTLCVAAPYHLESVASGAYGGTSGPCNQGQFLFRPTQAFLALHGLVPGTTVFGQFLSRDNGFPAPNAIGLTDAITFTVGP